MKTLANRLQTSKNIETIPGQKLLERHIKPNSKVVVIGAHESFRSDPTAAFAAIRVGVKGKVRIVDCQSGKAYARLSSKLKLSKKEGSLKKFLEENKPTDDEGHGIAGDPEKYVEEFAREMKKQGIKHAKLEPDLANALETRIKSSSINTVVDHGSARYVVNLQVEKVLPNPLPVPKKGDVVLTSRKFDVISVEVMRKAQEKLARKLVREYLRILKPGGKAVLLHTRGKEAGKEGFGGILERVARQTGHAVKEYSLAPSEYRVGSEKITPAAPLCKAIVITKGK